MLAWLLAPVTAAELKEVTAPPPAGLVEGDDTELDPMVRLPAEQSAPALVLGVKFKNWSKI